MNKKIRWIAETAVMLALLITLQWVGSFVPEQMTKQLITGTLVNCVLAITVLIVGLGGGIAVALISPVCAFLFHIAPNIVTVLPIMVGNCCYVALLHFILGKTRSFGWRQPVALVSASVVKFGVLYLLVVEVICGVASGALLGAVGLPLYAFPNAQSAPCRRRSIHLFALFPPALLFRHNQHPILHRHLVIAQRHNWHQI